MRVQLVSEEFERPSVTERTIEDSKGREVAGRLEAVVREDLGGLGKERNRDRRGLKNLDWEQKSKGVSLSHPQSGKA